MAEKIVHFPDIPKDHYYEHYLSALIALSGRFVERSVVQRGEEEILELDIVSTVFDDTDFEKAIIEIKGGKKWGFPDIFKVRGWMDYLDMKNAFFIVQDTTEKNIEFKRKIATDLGICLLSNAQTDQKHLNDKEIEVKQYLSINEKLKLITAVLQQVAQNEYHFANPVQMDVYTTLEIVYAYAPGIEFSEEDKADPAALYDEIEKYDLADMVISAIPKTEYEFLIDGIEKTVNAYYTYCNSVKGIIEDVTTDYKNLDLDATEIQKKIGDPDNLTLLKTIVEKLG